MTLLRRPGIARLGAAGLLSELGDWMLFIALPLYVLKLQGALYLAAAGLALRLSGRVSGVVTMRAWPSTPSTSAASRGRAS